MAPPERTPEERSPGRPPCEAEARFLDKGVEEAEARFLREGIEEVRASAEAVYTENVELRSRIELLTGLTSRLAQASGLPQDVRTNLKTVLKTALPPQVAFDPIATKPPEPPVCDAEPARNMVQGRVFALNVKELCRSMDRYQPVRERPGGGPGSGGSSTASSKQQDRGGDDEQLALTEYGEDLWSRTKAVCVELFTGWG
mmetsp:Transcript_111544/g.347702  ORF Transcript_111544/g.347702 Transcript_111544/m.347702 type:complete len:200 (+) Transcript_111544:68-667(+)